MLHSIPFKRWWQIKVYTSPLFLITLFIVIFSATTAVAQDNIFDSNGNSINIDSELAEADKHLELGNTKEATRHLNLIAEGYWSAKQYPKAIKYYIRSIRLNEEIDNQSGIGSISSNLGMIHADLKDYENSLNYFKTAISIRKTLNETSGRISSHINASVVLNKLRRYDESIENLNHALLLSTETNDPDRMKSCYGMLAETYEKKGDGEKMIQYYNLYRTFHELVERNKYQEITLQAKESELKAQYHAAQQRIKELELQTAKHKITEKENIIYQKDTIYRNLIDKNSKTELANQIIVANLQLQDLKILQGDKKLKREESFVNGLFIAIISVCFLLILLFYIHQQKRKANNELSKKNLEVIRQHSEILIQQEELANYYNIISSRNEHITSSINYAKLIQQAVLGKIENIHHLFNDSFVFFKPKDIVSGDFFWFKQVNGYSMLAVADCTGHGVPGAFMSILGVNLINQIVNNGIHEVDEILNHLSTEVHNALNQNNNAISRDGMDISFISIDKKNKQLNFSGAKHSLYYIQNKKLYIAKGDRISIGNTHTTSINNFKYTKHSIDITSPISIYAFTDGIVDQFNNKDDKKFLRCRLKKILLDIHEKPANEQKNILDKTFTHWKGSQTQTDDVLVVGINLEPNCNSYETSQENHFSVSDK